MVFLALSRRGFEDFMLLKPVASIWIAAGILNATEIKKLRSENIDITNFNHEIDSNDPAAILQAIETIQTHNPDASIWVEA